MGVGMVSLSANEWKVIVHIWDTLKRCQLSAASDSRGWHAKSEFVPRSKRGR